MKKYTLTQLKAISYKQKNCLRSGFTLIEIAVVMAIIGMIMLLVIPKLPSSDQENLKTSAKTLVSTLRYIEERVSTTKTGYFITLKPGSEFIKISELVPDGSAIIPSDPLLQKSPLKEGIIVADARIPRLGKIVDGELRIDVGIAGIRDFVTIHLRSQDGKFWTIMAFPSGGKVKAYEGYLENPP